MNKGVFGTITNIAVNTVFIFILFGVLLEGTGAGHTLLKFAFILTRRTRGGPAQAAILASSMFGFSINFFILLEDFVLDNSS